MTRYIDADKLQEEFKKLHGGKRSLLIDTTPTADVVDVVRCKDCKHYGKFGMKCNKLHLTPIESWRYCSYGERAEE